MIELSFTVSEVECVEAWTKLARRRRSRIALTIRWVSLGIVWIAGLALLNQEQFVSGTVAIGVAILIPIAGRFYLRRVLRRNYREAPFMHSQIGARIDEDGTTMTYRTGSSVTTWDGYQSCFETKDMFVLKLSTTFIRIFPKRAFSPAQLLEFRQLLQNHNLSPSN